MPAFAVVVTVLVALACPALTPFVAFAVLNLHIARRRRSIARARLARARAIAEERHERARILAYKSLLP